jgi:hypothetical protein
LKEAGNGPLVNSRMQRKIGQKNMDIVAIMKNGKVTLQLTERTEDVRLGVNPCAPGFPDDTLWETPDHRFRHRPTSETIEHHLLVRGRSYSIISEGVPLSAIKSLQSDDEIVNRLFQRGFVIERYECEK